MDEQTSLNSASKETFGGALNFDEADFDEADFDEAGTEGDEESENAQSKADEPKESQEPFLTVRYNKADKGLTREEAKELAQKGMNYDKVMAELDSYRNGPIVKAMKAYAEQAGMTIDKYAEMMSAQAEAAAEKKAMDELREKWPEAPDDLLQEYVRMQRGENQAKAASAADAKRQKEWDDALAEYPDVKPDAIPQEVHDAVAHGKTPLEALREHEIAQLRAKVTELTAAKETEDKQNDNRARSSGSLASMGKKDDGFLSEFA